MMALKLRERAVRIVMAETGIDEETATAALEASNWIVKTAIRQVKPQINAEKDG